MTTRPVEKLSTKRIRIRSADKRTISNRGQAGSRIHREYWIPAEELAEFNRHIVGQI